MFDNVLSFLEKHQSFILTTHDPPDADGIGAQIVMASILKKKGKNVRIINSSPPPNFINFMDHDSIVEIWENDKHSKLTEQSAFLVMDTSDEYHTGTMKENLKKAKGVFIFDHHEPLTKPKYPGLSDPTASSTCELVVEFAEYAGVDLDIHTATAAYAGIVYDSGFFAYPKTTLRTFEAARKALNCGVEPNYVYRMLMENGSSAAILLQKQALSNLNFYINKKISVMILHKEDFEIAGGDHDDTEGIVNIPMKARDVEVSILIKEKQNGEVRCSLRSKKQINVSKIAQEFGGGGHISAAGFKSKLSPEKTLKKLLAFIEKSYYK